MKDLSGTYSRITTSLPQGTSQTSINARGIGRAYVFGMFMTIQKKEGGQTPISEPHRHQPRKHQHAPHKYVPQYSSCKLQCRLYLHRISSIVTPCMHLSLLFTRWNYDDVCTCSRIEGPMHFGVRRNECRWIGLLSSS